MDYARITGPDDGLSVKWRMNKGMMTLNDTGSSSAFYSDIETTVKFYDPEKGYGFVEVSDGSPDAWLPASAVEAAGFRNLSKGVVLFCEIVPGTRNPEVASIHFVDTMTGKVQFLAGAPRPHQAAAEPRFGAAAPPSSSANGQNRRPRTRRPGFQREAQTGR